MGELCRNLRRRSSLDAMVVPVYGGESKVLCYNACKPEWSPDAASLYLASALEPPYPILFVPLQPGHAFPEFPAGKKMP